ncbi:hypothetical protein [Shivajiella indica]|uniref:DUF2780 domain-containing protein n=1 Tax=Shivajiella indica TaxID=872115 RepID=A0ABW5B6C1_9BACT
MKKLLILAAFVFGAFFSQEVKAQIPSIPKIDLPTQVLGALNTFEGLGLSSDQESKLKANNQSFTDDIFKVLNSSATDAVKKNQFLDLKNTRQNFLMGLLGQQLLGKYNTNISNLIKPFKKQLGLAALAF